MSNNIVNKLKGGGKVDNIRILTEKIELNTLSSKAVKSCQSKGRKIYEPECDVRTAFQRDRDRIIHCKAFRRLKHKTQVFLAPESDHYRTRLTHTLEVAQIARTISRALRLNEDLTEAIALGHDLGHTPFGHAGERALDVISESGFHHFEQSVRVCERLEKNFKGLNLTAEVLDGILNHTKGDFSKCLEGRVVRVSDKIAYINHDIDDAVRAGIIKETDIDSEICDILGYSKSERINTMVKSVIFNSIDDIVMDSEIWEQFDKLHNFLFERVYTNPVAKGEESKVAGILTGIYEHIIKNPQKLPLEYAPVVETEGLERAVLDYIAGMTDHYAIEVYKQFYIPKSWALDV